MDRIYGRSPLLTYDYSSTEQVRSRA